MAQGHAFALRHRYAVTAIFCCILACASFMALHSRTDMTTLSFFPDADPELVRMAEALHMAPFSRLLMVDFSFGDQVDQPEQGTLSQDELIQTAEQVLQALPQGLAVHATAVPALDPTQLLPLIPALTDAKALAYLQSQANAALLEEKMQTAKAELGQLWGAFALPWLQQDPLHFRQVLFARLPSMQNFGQVDTQSGMVLSEDGQHVLLVLRPQFSMHEVEQAAHLVQKLEEAIEQYVPKHIQVLSTGAYKHSAANAATIEADIQRILLWSLVGFAAVYMLFVRSWTGAVWLLLTPMVAGILAWGAVASVWPLIAGLALGFGASILGIAEDYAIHMHFALRHGAARAEDSASVLQALYKPLVQAFLLNATGFGMLLFSGIPALRQLAAFALFTLGGGLLFALCILPLWPSFAKPSISASVQKSAYTGVLPVMRTKLALSMVLCLFVLCTVLWKSITVDVSPQSMGADMAQIRADMQHMQSIWGDQESQNGQEIYVVQGSSAEQALAHAKEVVQALQAQGKIAHSLSSLWPSAQEMQENMARWQSFVQEQHTLYAQVQAMGVAQGFTKDSFAPFAAWLQAKSQSIDAQLLSQAGLEPLLHTFVGEGKNSQGQERFFALVTVQEGESAQQNIKPIDKAVPMPMPHNAVALTAQGLETKLVHILQAEQYLFPLTGLVCILLLLAFSPKKKDILLATLPPLVALNGILAVFLWQDMPLTLASMAALPLVLGLAVDHGIVMTHELCEGKNYGVSRAIITSSCTAILGMGLLMLAEHPALHSMGQVIVAGLVVEVPVALWCIPLLYKKGGEGIL